MEKNSDARFVFHIGANKTGSSAVQAFLRTNWRSLREMRFLVPDRELGTSERVTGEHVFAFQDLMNRSDRAGLETKLHNLAKSDLSTIIFSAENLSNNNNFQFFGKALGGISTKVILYVRRQDELLTSSWQQWHSKRETDFHAWLILALQRIGHWQRCIEGWENVVGAGNVTVRVFQKSDLVEGDVVDDFSSILGINASQPPLVKPSSFVNPSYSDVITEMVSGSKFLFSGEHDEAFYKMVGDLTGTYFVEKRKVSLLSREQRNKTIEYYRAENEVVCKRFFPSRPRLFDAVEHSKYDYLDEREMVKRQFEVLLALVYAMYRKDK